MKYSEDDILTPVLYSIFLPAKPRPLGSIKECVYSSRFFVYHMYLFFFLLFCSSQQNVIPVAFLILALIVVQTLPGVNDAPPPFIFGLEVRCIGIVTGDSR